MTADFAYPARAAYAGAVSRLAGGIVFAGAIICAVQSERTGGTDLQTLFSARVEETRETILIARFNIALTDTINRIIYFVIVKARLALALARHVMATGTVIAVAGLRTVLAPETFRASIRADRTLRDRHYVKLFYAALHFVW